MSPKVFGTFSEHGPFGTGEGSSANDPEVTDVNSVKDQVDLPTETSGRHLEVDEGFSTTIEKINGELAKIGEKMTAWKNNGGQKGKMRRSILRSIKTLKEQLDNIPERPPSNDPNKSYEDQKVIIQAWLVALNEMETDLKGENAVPENGPGNPFDEIEVDEGGKIHTTDELTDNGNNSASDKGAKPSESRGDADSDTKSNKPGNDTKRKTKYVWGKEIEKRLSEDGIRYKVKNKNSPPNEPSKEVVERMSYEKLIEMIDLALKTIGSEDRNITIKQRKKIVQDVRGTIDDIKQGSIVVSDKNGGTKDGQEMADYFENRLKQIKSPSELSELWKKTPPKSSRSSDGTKPVSKNEERKNRLHAQKAIHDTGHISKEGIIPPHEFGAYDEWRIKNGIDTNPKPINSNNTPKPKETDLAPTEQKHPPFNMFSAEFNLRDKVSYPGIDEALDNPGFVSFAVEKSRTLGFELDTIVEEEKNDLIERMYEIYVKGRLCSEKVINKYSKIVEDNLNFDGTDGEYRDSHKITLDKNAQDSIKAYIQTEIMEGRDENILNLYNTFMESEMLPAQIKAEEEKISAEMQGWNANDTSELKEKAEARYKEKHQKMKRVEELELALEKKGVHPANALYKQALSKPLSHLKKIFMIGDLIKEGHLTKEEAQRGVGFMGRIFDVDEKINTAIKKIKDEHEKGLNDSLDTLNKLEEAEQKKRGYQIRLAQLKDELVKDEVVLDIIRSSIEKQIKNRVSAIKQKVEADDDNQSTQLVAASINEQNTVDKLQRFSERPPSTTPDGAQSDISPNPFYRLVSESSLREIRDEVDTLYKSAIKKRVEKSLDDGRASTATQYKAFEKEVFMITGIIPAYTKEGDTPNTPTGIKQTRVNQKNLNILISVLEEKKAEMNAKKVPSKKTSSQEVARTAFLVQLLKKLNSFKK
jgi:hypothetical protein